MTSHVSSGSVGAPGTGLPTAADVVQNLPWRWRVQGRIFLIGGLGFMFDAWDVTLNGVLIPLVSKEWALDRPTAGLLSTANLVGMALGAFVWGAIADRIGRKAAFSATLLVFSVFTLAGALAPDFLWFCIFRFVAGFGLGGAIPVDYALVGEFAPTKQRGKVLTAMDGWWPIGAALCFFVSALIQMFTSNWRLILVVMVIPALMVFWIRRSVPESPLFLLSKGKPDAARGVIDRLVKDTGAPATEYTLPPAEAPPRFTWRTLTDQFSEIWRFNWRVTASNWLLFLTILLVYYLALNWMPSILIEAGMQAQTALFANGAMAAVGLLGVVVAAVLVERTGRKWILAITGPLSAALLAIVAYSLGTPPAAVTWLLVFGFVIQIAIPVLYAYVSELYPTDLRGRGFGWASTFSRLGAGFGPLIFATALWPTIGLANSFWVAGAMVLVAVVIMAFVSPETRAKALR
ncbi:MFS transporter [Haematomicrobium sanguinis]|uniref:MFS transporter n=1 Tax=Haematomicrobium sanguinis TaxID=479106 RepID=UPI000689921F|nr:MFS transporter [Haematomicrobium sanguinis]